MGHVHANIRFIENFLAKFHPIMSNTQSAALRDIIYGSFFDLRWGIEESFRELKDDFCFDQYQVRHQEQIQRHWIIAFLAWTLTYWIKQNACLSKILSVPPESLGQCKHAIATLIIVDSTCLLSKNKKIAESLNIKSRRFAERLEI
jgi:hypothetical protein